MVFSIGNPLGTIRNVIFSLGQTILQNQPNTQRMLEMAERNVMRCDGIIEELLDCARPHEKGFQSISIDSWLDELLQEQVLNSEIELVKNLNTDSTLVIEPERFRRAVINAIQNACQALMKKFHLNAGEAPLEMKDYQLRVQTLANPDRFEIRIEDTALGIPPNQYERIFDPLYSTKSFGVGLGLPIVQEIMQQHGGGIEVESQQNEGA